MTRMHRSATSAARPARDPLWLAGSMLPDVVDGSPSKNTSLQRLVLLVVGMLSGGNRGRVTLERLIDRWPSWVPMPHKKVLVRTLRRLVERDVVEQLGERGYQVNRDLATAAARRGARFRFVPEDFDGQLTAAEVDVLALLRGMQSARGHSAEHLAQLLGRDERSIRGAISGRGAQAKGGKGSPGLIAKGRLHVAGETRLRRGNRVPVLLVVEAGNLVGKSTNAGVPAHRSPDRWNSSPGRRNGSPDTLDPAGPDPAGMDHRTSEPTPAPATTPQRGGCAADDPPAAEPQQKRPVEGRLLAMPAAVEAEGRAALASWPAWQAALRRALTVTQVPVSGDLVGYADAWLSVLTMLGVLVPNVLWRGRGPETLRRRRRELAERLAREQGHPDVGVAWLHAEGRRIAAQGKTPVHVAAALIASVHAKDPAQIAGTRNPCGVELSQLVAPQGGRDAKQLPQSWVDTAMTDEDRAKAAAATKLADGFVEAQAARHVGGDIACLRIRARAELAARERFERDLDRRRRAEQLEAVAGRSASA